ncbi:hypothetical protein AAHA92_29044 [Salvia divinorum]|uniref:Uncharacterized protein n=1 Tax=Salvia divinorum TaxID=28513 RepID=A0ABD1FX19_SALDI
MAVYKDCLINQIVPAIKAKWPASAKIMQVKGGNNYKIPHMNKARLRNLGILPQHLEVHKDLVKECLNYLLLPENEAGGSIDIAFLSDYFQL